MTEVRQLQQHNVDLTNTFGTGRSSSTATTLVDGIQHQQQYGLFATKDYNIGDCILMESIPLIQLSSSSSSSSSSSAAAAAKTTVGTTSSQVIKYEQEWMEEMMMMMNIETDTSSFTSSSVPQQQDDEGNKMMAMVQVALNFILYLSTITIQKLDSTTTGCTTILEIIQNDPVLQDLRQLYHPSPTTTTITEEEEEEQSLMVLSQQAVTFVVTKLMEFIKNADSTTTSTGSCTTTNHLSTTSHKNKNKNNKNANDPQYMVWVMKLRNMIETLFDSNHVSQQPLPVEQEQEKTIIDPKRFANMILHEIILIWACNAFDGGRIYRTFSRINHSCNPNAVVIVDTATVVNEDDDVDTNDRTTGSQSSKQQLVAATPISVGDEIYISYLQGPMLYADSYTRQQILVQDKYFTCTCPRCCHSQQIQKDVSSATPCCKCHPREPPTGIQLSEDVQYDDDHNVNYTYLHVKTILDTLDVSVTEFCCDNCPSRSLRPNNNHPPSGNEIQQYCNIYSTNHVIIEKVVSFLRSNNSTGGLQEEEEHQLMYMEQLEQLLQMSSSVLGAKHWTTNMLLLYQLNHTLTSFHTRSIMKLASPAEKNSNSNDDDDDDDDTEATIAEAIDMLQRIERFVVGITSIQLHMGHLLSDVMIGVARALVTLGDVKSKKYAAQWMDKILVYINQFESSGQQAVVHTLHTAWTQQQNDIAETETDETSRTTKRSKH